MKMVVSGIQQPNLLLLPNLHNAIYFLAILITMEFKALNQVAKRFALEGPAL